MHRAFAQGRHCWRMRHPRQGCGTHICHRRRGFRPRCPQHINTPRCTVALTSRTNPSRGASTRRLPQQQQSCVDRHPLRLGTRNRTTPYCVRHTIARQSRCRLPPSALAHAATEKPAAVGHPGAATITLRQPGPLAGTAVDSQAASEM